MSYFTEWMGNIAFYMVLVNVAAQMLPTRSYGKYIRFFTGLVLMLMLSGPVLKIFGLEEAFWEFYESAEYEQKVKEIEGAAKYLEEFSGEIN